MKVISLTGNDPQVTISKFTGGENHVRFLHSMDAEEKVQLRTRLNSSDDVMTLCLAVDALRHMGLRSIEAFIPYIPYARQDRVMVPGEPLSVKVFAGIINALALDKVIVFDAHSDVSVALIDRCVNVANHDMVAWFLHQEQLSDYTLVSPDVGAYKKVDKLAQVIGYRGEIATGLKIRDLATGQIVKSDVNVQDLDGRSCVVVDDICDGGRTFIELAAALKTKGAGKLYFIASHGIFSHNALDRLKETGYTVVCASNSIADRPSNGSFKQYDLFGAL